MVVLYLQFFQRVCQADLVEITEKFGELADQRVLLLDLLLHSTFEVDVFLDDRSYRIEVNSDFFLHFLTFLGDLGPLSLELKFTQFLLAL